MSTTRRKNKKQSRFATNPQPQIMRSAFDRSHGHKTTMNAGDLVPVFLDEALPGDTFNMQATLFGRIATLIRPIMDNVYIDMQFFAVPMRLLWVNWEKFMGAQDDPGDSTEFIIPQGNSVTPIAGTLQDYMGLISGMPNVNYSAMFFRAYNLIWNEWYRDQNLQDSVINNTDDGPDAWQDFNLLKRGKRHDYFTSCLPWPQKGNPVTIGLAGSAPVISAGDGEPLWSVGATSHNLRGDNIGGDPLAKWTGGTVEEGPNAKWDETKLEVDLSTATATTINDLRTAFQMQKLLERDARGGTRYTELIRSHFGVTSADSRLQRPEYLGGLSSIMTTREVPASIDSASAEQGDLSAYGTMMASGKGFVKSFEEHSIVIGLVSIRADLTYQQGIERMWSRRTKFDFYWPSFAHLGEQAVLNKEIFWQDDPADDDVFGYQERFAEYRYKPSRVSGVMRSGVPGGSLHYWHLAQEFADLPILGDTFIQENPPIDRVVAVPSSPKFLLDTFFQYHCVRPMPTYSVPGMIDHF